MSLPPPPSRESDLTSQPWQKWFSLIREAINSPSTTVATESTSTVITNSTQYNSQDFIHDDLSGLNEGDYVHLSATEFEGLTGLEPTDLHDHDFDHVTFPIVNTIGTMTQTYTLSNMMDHIWSSGVVDGGVLTDNGNGTVSISIAVAAIRASTDPHGTIKGVEVAANLNIALTDNATNYLYLDYAAGTPVWTVTTTSTTANGLDKVLAYEIHRQGIVLHAIDRRNQTVDALRKINSLFTSFAKFIHAEGGTVLGVSGLYLTVTAGLFYRGVEPISHVAFDTSVAGLANENTYVLWNHVAGVYTATEDVKLVSTTTWDNGTNSATLDNNKFGVSWVYIVNDSPSELHVVMGQAQYLKLSDAVVATPPSTLPTLIDGVGSLIGFVAYEKSNTVFDGVFSAFATSFTPGLATQHNSLGGLQGGTIGEYYHLTSAQATDLTDAGDSILHYHAADRARANHTGTQSADTLTDGTTNKVYTVTEQTRLANTSGTNTGDQTSVTGNSGTTTAALGLKTATTTVSISAATAPTAGQVLTSTSSTAATWQTIAGTGDVVGPASSVNNNVVLFNGTTGKLIKDSGLALSGTNTGDQTNITGNAATSNLLGHQWSGYTANNTTATVLFPSDSVYSSAVSVATGAFKIKIPSVFASTTTMFKMRVELLDFTLGEHVTFFIGGYATTALTWTNETVLILSGNNTKNFTVRFGNDGIDRFIWIGELTDTWAYPKIYISEVMASYSTASTIANLSSGWSISLATAFDTVEDTISNNFPIAKESFALKTATTTVSVSGATAPTSGQVLTATSSTNATWQDQTFASGATIAQARAITSLRL